MKSRKQVSTLKTKAGRRVKDKDTQGRRHVRYKSMQTGMIQRHVDTQACRACKCVRLMANKSRDSAN